MGRAAFGVFGSEPVKPDQKLEAASEMNFPRQIQPGEHLEIPEAT
jgi:hypothetical protein